MGQRNALCCHQILNLQSNRSHSYIHPDHCIFSSNTVDCTNRSVHPVLSALGNTADLGFQLRDFNDWSTFYGNQYNHVQNSYGVPNLHLGATAPSNFYNHCIVPLPTSRIFPDPQNNGSTFHFPSSINQRDLGISLDEFGRITQFVDGPRGFCKRKNTEAAPGNYYGINGPASSSSSTSLSLNSRWPQWDHLYESGANLMGAPNYTPSEHQERGTIPTTEGSHISAANNAWTAQFGNGNNNRDGGCSNWNYNHAITYTHGGRLPSGSVEMTNMDVQTYHDASSRRNSAIPFHPAPLPDFHQNLSHVQTIQVQNYSHHAQIPAPSYQQPFNNLYPFNVNPSSDGLRSGFRFLHLPPSAQQIYRPHQRQHTAPDLRHGSLRILSSEDAMVMELSGVYGSGNVIDQHHEMRLDIDNMSYEELLALEERIGDVNTGLTEECITKNLKTSTYAPQTSSSFRYQENGACIICQVEYKENEAIATLDCGHGYHGDCIKQWLLMKNLCPICKTSALVTDKGER